MATRKAHAAPTKEFFVRMITKDIDLADAILDLIDNCLDGARRLSLNAAPATRYKGFWARVVLGQDRFRIEDNCGGIGFDQAINHAFHFGRRRDAPLDEHSIGLYGIGMKRAIFKMGNLVTVRSSTARDAFRTNIDVEQWLSKPQIRDGDGDVREDWDFDLEEAEPLAQPGTLIEIEQLHAEIARQFADPSFVNALTRIVSRDYARFLEKGFEIRINELPITGFRFAVREGEEIKPLRSRYRDETGVDVEIVAGMAAPPPDDLGPTERRSETEYYGWFVVCNDRVIVASDKRDQTGWGSASVPVWHSQYNGFLGMVEFSADDPSKLPWRTTKRDVDDANPIYRRALLRMQEAAAAWVKYTNDRRVDMERAKQSESRAASTPIRDVAFSDALKMPAAPAERKVSYSSIQYSKPVSEIAKAKKLLKNPNLSNARLGEATFDYFLQNEGEV